MTSSPPAIPRDAATADAVTELALRLIGTDSLSGYEGGAAALLGDELAELGFTTETDEYGNVIGTLEFGPGPTILFDAHLDTVPVSDAERWAHDPGGELTDGRLFGRGAVDTKGPLAACVRGVAALRGHHGAGRVVVSGTVAEELVEGPALQRVAQRVQPDAVVICEPSGGLLMVGPDLIVALRTLPLPTHPQLGPAILVVTDVLSRPYPGLSVVPGGCVATFDRRTLPGESVHDVLAPIHALARELSATHGAQAEARIAVDELTTYTGAELQAPNFAPAWITPRDTPLVTAALAGLHAAGMQSGLGHYAFCTNGSGSAGILGIPTLGFGPGQEDAAHTADESISVQDLLSGARSYAALARALTSLTPEDIRTTPASASEVWEEV
jgi:acetylornithine deacetylase/succinyl-diaminopimelate desuccinylase-like protein